MKKILLPLFAAPMLLLVSCDAKVNVDKTPDRTTEKTTVVTPATTTEKKTETNKVTTPAGDTVDKTTTTTERK